MALLQNVSVSTYCISLWLDYECGYLYAVDISQEIQAECSGLHLGLVPPLINVAHCI